MNNAVGAMALALIVNVEDPRASKLRISMGGTAPGVGESHFAFPSDSFTWSCRGSFFDVRDELSVDAGQDVCAQLVVELRRLEAGDKSKVARWVSGRPVRISVGGVGGARMLGMTPEPVLFSAFQAVVGNHRNVKGLSVEYV